MKGTSIIQIYDFDKLTGWRKNLHAEIAEGTRVLCLYRVSSNKQLYFDEKQEADIPMQRKRCRKFCEEKGWTIVCELQEEGVSGHKVRAENRDKIQIIKEYALQGRFDILLVFMFDRLGRIADETPFVLEWFVNHGIRVWSAEEGEQRIDTHTDRLLNYIRFWQADGESQKTSIRTANSLHILTEEGCFTGGTCPYGYALVKTGRTNKRKQEVNDLAICEDEAPVVRTIFKLAAVEGYGPQRIANYLNEQGIKNRSGKNWHPASIRGMIRNILYTGILRSGESRSQTLEQLQIIDPTTFERVQKLAAARSRRADDIRSRAVTTTGKSLLVGNIFCGHCGARLCVTTSGKGRRKSDGTDIVRVRYTCQTHTRTHGECDGQTGYTVEKLDAMIDAIMRGIFSRVQSMTRQEIIESSFDSELQNKKALLEKSKKDCDKAELELQKLKEEIVKSLTGESVYSPELLNSVIEQQEKKVNTLRESCLRMEQEVGDNEAGKADLAERYDEIIEWAYVYQRASTAAKKVIVSNIIERVDVYRGYQLKVKLNISVEQFLLGLESISVSDTDSAATA